MDKLSEQNEAFNPILYCNTEAFSEKLLKAAEKLQKKSLRQKGHKKICATAKL